MHRFMEILFEVMGAMIALYVLMIILVAGSILYTKIMESQNEGMERYERTGVQSAPSS